MSNPLPSPTPSEQPEQSHQPQQAEQQTPDQPSRILHLVNEVVSTGNGIVNVTVDLAVAQTALGHTVTVASAGGGFVELLESHGIRHITVPFDDRARAGTTGSYSLWSILRDVQPDIVHAHTPTTCILAAALRHAPGAPKFALVSTVHNVYQRSAPLMGLADVTVGVADDVAETIRAWRPSPRKVASVVNAVIGSPRRAPGMGTATAADVPLNLGQPSIVHVGAISERKGVDVLFEAFEKIHAEHPTAHLWYVGNPDWKEFVARISASPLAPFVHVPGLAENPAEYYRTADVVAVASRREGLALSLLEAREAGAAIVATETDGAREGLDGGDAGVLVPVEDADALASAVSTLFSDADALEALRAKSRANLDRFTIERMAKDYLAIYAEARG